MTYSDYTIEKSGRRGYRITLPCFSGEDDFDSARLMNRFYSTVLEKIRAYAEESASTASERWFLECSHKVYDDNKLISVELIAIILGPERRKHTTSVTHVWKRGIIIKKC